jgi:hypothetical protein
MQGVLMLFYGHNVSTAAALKTYLPFLILAVLAMIFLPPLYTLCVWLGTACLLVAVLHASDIVLRSYEARYPDTNLSMHGAPPYCWSSVGPPDTLVATPARPSEFLVSRPKVQRRIPGSTMQTLPPEVSPIR